MRRWAVVLLCIWALESTGQGLLVFNNRVGEEVVAPVYGIDPHNPAFSQYGTGLSYNGPPLAGAEFTAQLFGGTTNTPLDQLPPLIPAAQFRTADAGGYIAPPSRAVSVAGVPEGARAKVQLRAWNNRGGSITNWNQVLADPTIPRGASMPIITPPLGSVFIAPPNLIGLQSFNLVLPITVTNLRRTGDGSFGFDYLNRTTLPYCVEASTDLKQWIAAGCIAIGEGTFTDQGATNQNRRFYRLMPRI